MQRVFLVALALGVALLVWSWMGRGDSNGGDSNGGVRSAEPPPVAFENTAADVAYVGSESCKACHAAECESYAATPHGRSFAAVQVADEQVPASFHHVPSGVSYDIEAKDGWLRMRERLRPGGEGEGEVLQERNVSWVLGSGDRARMFLVDYDGFLAEAPVAHFAADAENPARWAMAPEYERAVHRSFDRMVPLECLSCHVGRAERVGPEDGRIRILEAAIGCENCHGPGALHAQRWAKEEAPAAGSFQEIDHTIVNPAHLTGRQSLDLCGRCHVTKAYSVENRDRDLSDWRPGLLLSDFRIRYGQKDKEWDPARRTYEDRLRGSACFQKSDDLTCVTCHGGHPQPTAAERTAWFRSKCLTCHEEEGCGLEPTQRREMSPVDDCALCHMPKEEAYEFHKPFTEHRVGRYDREPVPPAPSRARAQAEALDPVDHLSPDERERSRALGSMRVSVSPGLAQNEKLDLADEAVELLESLRMRDASDPEADAAFALLLQGRQQSKRSLKIVTEVLETPSGLSLIARVAALELSAELVMRASEWERAEATYEELRTLRRDPRDLANIAVCAVERGDLGRAKEAIEAAVEMAPYLASLRFQAGDVYQRAGEKERARYHNKLGERIERSRVR